MAAAHPALPADGANFEPLLKLINSKRNNLGWNPALRGALKSVVANRQYTQLRCYQVGWVKHPKCIFCLHSDVSGKQLVACMPEDTKHGSNDRSDRVGLLDLKCQCTSTATATAAST